MSEFDPNQFDASQYDKPKKETKGKAGKILLYILITALLCGSCSFAAVKYALKNERNTVVVYQSDEPASYDYTATHDITDVVEDIADTVVEVYTETTTYSQFFGSYISDGAGSGVIFSEDGYIITNHHVIEDATSITVKLINGDVYEATLIGSDEISDIAVLKIEANGLSAATFGDSDNLKVGQRCIAIGNPLGTLGGTVSDGIISALSRTITIEDQQMTLLQTNTAINPGNSGGGLFDLNGHLIGIVNAKSSGSEIEGIGFAIPINDAKTVVNDLLTYGYVVGRAAIGISCTSIDSVQKAWNYGVSSYGVYVNQIKSSEARAAGLQEKDLIIGIDDYTISSFNELQSVLCKYSAGDKVILHILRDNVKTDLTMTLAQKEQ